MSGKQKKILITQSNYIPWKGYFDSINLADVFVIYDDMQYTRRDWRNRNKIKTPDGVKWLTIPVMVKGKYLQKINETQIADSDWGSRHWKILCHNYRKAPFFELMEKSFEELFKKKNSDNLSTVNQKLIERICEFLKIRTTILRSEDFVITGNKSEKLLNVCKELGATHYLTGPAARAYLDVQLFEENGILVEWLDYSGYPVYNQLYPPFEHQVSILDLLFMEGHNAANYMKSFN